MSSLGLLWRMCLVKFITTWLCIVKFCNCLMTTLLGPLGLTTLAFCLEEMLSLWRAVLGSLSVPFRRLSLKGAWCSHMDLTRQQSSSPSRGKGWQMVPQTSLFSGDALPQVLPGAFSTCGHSGLFQLQAFGQHCGCFRILDAWNQGACWQGFACSATPGVLLPWFRQDTPSTSPTDLTLVGPVRSCSQCWHMEEAYSWRGRSMVSGHLEDLLLRDFQEACWDTPAHQCRVCGLWGWLFSPWSSTACQSASTTWSDATLPGGKLGRHHQWQLAEVWGHFVVGVRPGSHSLA